MEPQADYDPHAPIPGPSTVVIGCGNLLRGDDAAGPIAIRMLWERGVADRARLVDGGTAGMDVAFQMNGAKRVILIDAASTGSEPGALFRVPGEELENLPAPTELHSHSFRWDHALSFARWLLKDRYPREIEVWLIEVAGTEPGAEVSAPVRRTLEELVERLAASLPEPDEVDEPASAERA